MYKIVILPIARLNLQNIYDYLLEKTYNHEIAKSVIDEIYKKTIYLKIFPNIYQNTYKDFKTIQIKSYKVFYKIDESKKEVIVYRILWASQNFREYV